jgi:hypothetical protein
MSDPYRITPTSESTPAASPVRTTSPVRPVLWVLLVLSVAANAVSSVAGLHPAVGMAFGVLALAFVAALIVDHRRRRRS